eukprot:3949167-Amphidinium_carterae.1
MAPNMMRKPGCGTKRHRSSRFKCNSVAMLQPTLILLQSCMSSTHHPQPHPTHHWWLEAMHRGRSVRKHIRT